MDKKHDTPVSLTPDSLKLFRKIMVEADDFDGAEAYFLESELTKSECGNLSDLKTKNLVYTVEDDDGRGKRGLFVIFTDAGCAFRNQQKA